jgi:adenine-specific DNA-methyltransferase
MNTQREQTPRETPNLVDEQREKLRRLYPEAFTEQNIDWEKLKASLGDIIETSPERYSFTWAGKRDAIRLLQTPSRATLVPAKDESVNFETTQNIFIEGDNLEVLKLLYNSYFNKVKMIYIDPPYNTGKDFIYPDNYADPLDTYLKLTNQKDSEGNILTSNPETSGRYHSAWLSMMYPRLFLARQLLRDDGVIFVSIDNDEVHNLRLVFNEIFGEENLLGELVWDLGTGTAAGHFTRAHEYILCFAKNKNVLSNFVYLGEEDTISERAVKKVSKGNPASRILFPEGIEFEGIDATFREQIGNSEVIKIIEGEMIFKNGRLAKPVTLEAGWAMRNQILSWIEGKETFDSKGQKVIKFYFDKKGVLQYEKQRGFINPQSVLRNIGSTRKGSLEIEELFGASIMSFPKPVELIKYLAKIVCGLNDVVIDFFSGSSTTAHAVLELNREDGGNRKFILVQLPEPCAETSEAYKAGYKTIADIGKERIRRVIKKLEKEKEGKLDLQTRTMPEDLGFKVFKLAESNYKVWNSSETSEPEKFIKQAELFTDSLKDGWSEENVIYEVAIKEGYVLTSVIRKVTGKQKANIYKVTDNEKGQSLYLTLDDKVTLETLKGFALTKDDLFICRDIALDDQTAANLALQCRLKTI